jgi:hypothetical protein
MAKLHWEFYGGGRKDRFGLGFFVDTYEGLGLCLEFLWFYVGFTAWRPL